MTGQLRRFTPILIALALTLLASVAGVLSPLDRMFADFRWRAMQTTVPSDALIIAIDAKSLRELNAWPWSRSHHAALLTRLGGSEPAAVFLDIDFSLPSDDLSADAVLARALARPRDYPIVLPVFWQDASVGNSHSRVLTEPLAEFSRNTELGLVNLSPGPGGLVREALHADRFGERKYDSPGAVLAESNGLEAGRSYPIDFRIAPDSFTFVSYVDVLRGLVPASEIRGKRVFVGSTALELGDNVPVPLHRNLPGVTVQAMIYETLRQGIPVPVSGWAGAGLLGAIALALVAGGRRRWFTQLAVGLSLIAATVALSLYLLAEHNMLLDVSAPILFAVLGLVASLAALADRETMAALLAALRLKKERAMISAVFSASIDGILVIEADGTIREANAAAAEFFGAGVSLPGTALQSLLPGLSEVIEPGRTELPVEIEAGRTAVEVSISPAGDAAEQLLTVILRDVGERQRQQAVLKHQATHDPLTGLPNRTLLARNLKELRNMRTAALFMLDLDGFKKVNDTLGHRVGDEMLRELGKRLRRTLPKNVRVYRIGGDEFAVLVVRHGGKDKLQALAEQILERVRAPVAAGSMNLELTGSIGISLYPQHAADGDMLLQCADVAMYAAKAGHHGVQMYDAQADNNTVRNLKLAGALRRAVSEEQLSMVYQPKVRLSDGACVGVEALVRWQDPELGPVSPAEFIPVAETSDLIEPITRFTLNQAVRDHVRWCAEGIDMVVSVNLSARHLDDGDFADEILSILDWHGLTPDRLELEITETALMQDPEHARRVLDRLTSRGVRLAIDDFGTGFSSLAYLKHLHLHTLKIDRCFVEEMCVRQSDRKIVDSTLRMAHSLDLTVVAEGVETDAQASLLADMGCDLGQGYVFARPLDAAEFTAWYGSRAATKAIAPRLAVRQA